MKSKTNTRKPAKLNTEKRKGSSAPCRGSTEYAVEWKRGRERWLRTYSRYPDMPSAHRHAAILRSEQDNLKVRIIEIIKSERIL